MQGLEKPIGLASGMAESVRDTIWFSLAVVLVALYVLVCISGCAVVNVAGRDNQGTVEVVARRFVEPALALTTGFSVGRVRRRHK